MDVFDDSPPSSPSMASLSSPLLSERSPTSPLVPPASPPPAPTTRRCKRKIAPPSPMREDSFLARQDDFMDGAVLLHRTPHRRRRLDAAGHFQVQVAPPPPSNQNPFTTLKPGEPALETSPEHLKALSLEESTLTRFEKDFEIMTEIGTGSFGQVFRAKHRLEGVEYAVKKIQRRFRGEKHKQVVLREVYALAALKAHANIVQYHTAWHDDGQLYIQMELCASSLEQWQEEHSCGMTEKKATEVLRQLLLALRFLHGEGIAHLDIKPANVFVSFANTFKLGDFGLAAHLKADQREGQEVEEGDARYLPLELLQSPNTADLELCDIFSLGATIYELCLGQSLPRGGSEWQKIRKTGLTRPLVGFEEEFKEVLASMMHPSPSERPSASDLLRRKRFSRCTEQEFEMQREEIASLEKILRDRLEERKKKILYDRLKGKIPMLKRAHTMDV